MPWVSGSTCATDCIHPGSADTATLTPQKMMSNPMMMFESTAVSRTRSASAAEASPSPVHENADTASTATSGSQAATGIGTRSRTAPRTRTTADTQNPLTITGSARPRNSGSRRAGLASSRPRVWVRRSSPIVLPIANRHGIEASSTAFPIR